MAMDSSIVAAIIGVGGAAFLALCANAGASIYFAGRVSERLEDHERRISKVETVAEKASLNAATANAKLETA
jgi:hypothetical protein